MEPSRPRIEALLYCTVAAAGLGPVVAHLIWRPLTASLAVDHQGMAYVISIAASAIAALTTLATWHGLARRRAAGIATVAIAALVGVAIGGAAPAALALALTAGATRWATPRLLRDFPATLAPTGARRAAALAIGALVGALGVVAAVQLATFMGDAAYRRFAQPPGLDFYHTHYCMTAYAHAAELVRAGVSDVYDLSLVPLWATSADVPTAAHMAPFDLDRYGYPPQFLLVPLALSAVVPDFAAQRAAWFGLNGLLFAYALWTVAIWVGPRGGRIAVLGAPIVWLSSLVTLQSGNVHLAVIAVAMLGMRAFADRRAAPGGALLAAATLAKIAPGLLGVVLIMQRRWRAVAWTVAWAVALSGLALAVVGWGPFAAFINGHLPRTASGEAYNFLDDDVLTLITNWSPFSIPFKLDALGVEIDAWRWGPRVSAVFTALAFVLAAVGGRRAGDRRSSAAIWLVVLTLATMRSPMAAPYVTTSALWALLLLAAEPRGAGRWLGYGGAAALLGTAAALVGAGDPTTFGPGMMASALAGIVLLVALMAWMIVRRWPALDPPPEVPPEMPPTPSMASEKA